MDKKKILILILFLFVSSGITYSAFIKTETKRGNINTTDLTSNAIMINNQNFQSKIKELYPSIDDNLIDKNLLQRETDFEKVDSLNLSADYNFSNDESNVPIYVWLDNNILYYYTIAQDVDLNNE